MPSRRWRVVATRLLLSSLVLLTGCQYRLYAWVVGGSVAGHIVFGVSTRPDGDTPVRLASIRAYRCADIVYRGDRGYYPPDRQLVWRAQSTGSHAVPATTRFTWGVAPAGLVNDVSPRALEIPGCYLLFVHGRVGSEDRSVSVGFHVLAGGSVAQLTRDEMKALFRRGPGQ